MQLASTCHSSTARLAKPIVPPPPCSPPPPPPIHPWRKPAQHAQKTKHLQGCRKVVKSGGATFRIMFY